jgi:hypothetical protein
MPLWFSGGSGLDTGTEGRNKLYIIPLWFGAGSGLGCRKPLYFSIRYRHVFVQEQVRIMPLSFSGGSGLVTGTEGRNELYIIPLHWGSRSGLDTGAGSGAGTIVC